MTLLLDKELEYHIIKVPIQLLLPLLLLSPPLLLSQACLPLLLLVSLSSSSFPY